MQTRGVHECGLPHKKCQSGSRHDASHDGSNRSAIRQNFFYSSETAASMSHAEFGDVNMSRVDYEDIHGPPRKKRKKFFFVDADVEGSASEGDVELPSAPHNHQPDAPGPVPGFDAELFAGIVGESLSPVSLQKIRDLSGDDTQRGMTNASRKATELTWCSCQHLPRWLLAISISCASATGYKFSPLCFTRG